MSMMETLLVVTYAVALSGVVLAMVGVGMSRWSLSQYKKMLSLDD